MIFFYVFFVYFIQKFIFLKIKKDLDFFFIFRFMIFIISFFISVVHKNDIQAEVLVNETKACSHYSDLKSK